MTYGLKIKDAEGRTIKITPLLSSIVSSGLYNMPTSLNADNTYGFDIDLPGTNPIPMSNIVVLVSPLYWDYTGYLFNIDAGASGFMKDWYALSTATYYTMNAETTVMTQWEAGDCRYNDVNYWDKHFTTLPVTLWLTQFGQVSANSSTYNSIRIFGGVLNSFQDRSANLGVIAYNLYGVPSSSAGVSSVSVAVIISNWDY